MLKFLLDASLSYRTAIYLESLGYEAVTAAQLHLGRDKDITIAHYASAQGYILVTLDLDFGFLFYRLGVQPVGMIILRLSDQRRISVQAALTRILQTRLLDNPANQQALIIVDDKAIRIHRSPRRF